MLGHGQEITVLLQQNVAVLDAECADNHVIRLANGDSSPSERAEMRGSSHGEIRSQHLGHGELPEIALEKQGMPIIVGTLQHFEQNKISDKDRTCLCQLLERENGSAFTVAETVDPD